MTVSDLSGNAETNDGTTCCVNDAVENEGRGVGIEEAEKGEQVKSMLD